MLFLEHGECHRSLHHLRVHHTSLRNIDRPGYGGETKPRESYNTPADAWEDDTRVEYNARYGRGWQEYAASEMSEEEYGGPVKQNNTAFLMLAGAAIFAYALTR